MAEHFILKGKHRFVEAPNRFFLRMNLKKNLYSTTGLIKMADENGREFWYQYHGRGTNSKSSQGAIYDAGIEALKKGDLKGIAGWGTLKKLDILDPDKYWEEFQAKNQKEQPTDIFNFRQQAINEPPIEKETGGAKQLALYNRAVGSEFKGSMEDWEKSVDEKSAGYMDAVKNRTLTPEAASAMDAQVADSDKTWFDDVKKGVKDWGAKQDVKAGQRRLEAYKKQMQLKISEEAKEKTESEFSKWVTGIKKNYADYDASRKTENAAKAKKKAERSPFEKLPKYMQRRIDLKIKEMELIYGDEPRRAKIAAYKKTAADKVAKYKKTEADKVEAKDDLYNELYKLEKSLSQQGHLKSLDESSPEEWIAYVSKLNAAAQSRAKRDYDRVQQIRQELGMPSITGGSFEVPDTSDTLDTSDNNVATNNSQNAGGTTVSSGPGSTIPQIGEERQFGEVTEKYTSKGTWVAISDQDETTKIQHAGGSGSSSFDNSKGDSGVKQDSKGWDELVKIIASGDSGEIKKLDYIQDKAKATGSIYDWNGKKNDPPPGIKAIETGKVIDIKSGKSKAIKIGMSTWGQIRRTNWYQKYIKSNKISSDRKAELRKWAKDKTLSLPEWVDMKS